MATTDSPWSVRACIVVMRVTAILGLSLMLSGTPAVAAGCLVLWFTIDVTPLTTYLMDLLADKRAAKACFCAIELADAAIRGISELLYWLFGVVFKSAVYSILAVVMFYAGDYSFRYFTGQK